MAGRGRLARISLSERGYGTVLPPLAISSKQTSPVNMASGLFTEAFAGMMFILSRIRIHHEMQNFILSQA
jgi:hypothetical protein